jgi:hypothetical protein
MQEYVKLGPILTNLTRRFSVKEADESTSRERFFSESRRIPEPRRFEKRLMRAIDRDQGLGIRGLVP